jgi:hypothetical protein
VRHAHRVARVHTKDDLHTNGGGEGLLRD